MNRLTPAFIMLAAAAHAAGAAFSILAAGFEAVANLDLPPERHIELVAVETEMQGEETEPLRTGFHVIKGGED